MSKELIKENGGEIFNGNEWILPTDINLLDGACENFKKRVLESGWSEDEVYFLEIGFREALINAIVHGNLEIKERTENESWYDAAVRKQAEGNDKSIKVKVGVTPDKIEVTIKDEGEGFDWKKEYDFSDEEALLKPSGRGGVLIKNFFDSVEYNEKGNEITLRKEKK